MLRTFTLILFILSLSGNLYSQDSTANDNSSVLITVSSKGSSIEDLRLNASRLAIEQAFGTFISSNTQILNDNLVRDEIISVSNGNVRKFEIIDEKKDLSGSYIGSYKVLVSVNQLKNFCTAKGIKIEFAGGVFTKNIKLQELYENSELKAIWNTLFILNPILNKSFDYKATASDPKSIEGTKDFKVNFLIDCYVNENHQFVFDYLANVLMGLSLSEEDQKTYKNLNKKIWLFRLNGNSYFLRNKKSFDVLNLFFDEIKWIQRRYVIFDGVKNYVGTFTDYTNFNRTSNTKFRINNVYGTAHDGRDTVWLNKFVFNQSDEYSGFEDISIYANYDGNKGYYLNEFSPGYSRFYESNHENYFESSYFRSRGTNEKIKTFDITLTYSLDELEKISNFSVEHSSKYSRLSQWYNGGVIFYEDSLYILLHPIDEFLNFTFSSQQYCYECDKKDKFTEECADLKICPTDQDDLKTQIGLFFEKTQTDSILGSGYDNTKRLAVASDTIKTPFKFVNSLTINGFSDWFIPSKVEALHLVQYWRKYLTVQNYFSTFKIGYNWFRRNIMTSSLDKEKRYDLHWDSFYEIKEYDNDHSIAYFQPIDIIRTNLFDGNLRVFHPIRMEKKK